MMTQLTDLQKKLCNILQCGLEVCERPFEKIAQKLNTKAYHAVGQALRHNDKPIVIPCHRVVASDGSLGGYAGRMNSRKKIALLRKEGIEVKNNKVVEFDKIVFKF